jgi:glucose/arabinose dehydrogenase
VVVFRVPLLRLTGIDPDLGAPGLTTLRLPAGYTSTVFVDGLRDPRFMAVAPDGTLLVAERGADRVIALPDRDRDGVADETIVVGSGYDLAHSLAVAGDGQLLVAGVTRVTRVAIGGDLRETARSTFLDGLPGGGHTTRTVQPLPGGSVLLSVGSSCNVCEETDDRRAAVSLIPPQGGSSRVFMRGLRNAVGLTIDPVTGDVWATNMGRDFLGDDSPPETLYRVQDGADAGWPRCHAGTIVDPDFGARPSPATGAIGGQGVVAPQGMFQAHAAPLAIAFWQDRALIAFHGSWNRSSKVGYEVAWMPWSDGPAGPLETFAGGFLDPSTGQATGRPAGLVVGADDALYVSDDKAGIVYRISAP